MKGTLHAELRTYMISRSVLRRIRNISDERYRENQNTHFLFNNILF